MFPFDLQNTILSSSPALLPLLTFPLSFVQSWHCSVMCSPIYLTKSPAQRNRYLQGRWLSYSCAGAVFGVLGETLRKLLEVEVVGALAFFIFCALTVSMVLLWIGTSTRFFKLPSLSKLMIEKRAGQSAFLQGVLSVALPCGLLYQIFGLSAVSHSLIGGLLIGSAHAAASTPSFWMSSKVLGHFRKLGSRAQWALKILLLLLVVFNLLYFAGSFLYSPEEAKSKILFCM